MARARMWAFVGGSLIVASLAHAATTRPAAPAGVPKLIAQLGSESHPQREKAMEALVALGQRAVPALEAARKHTDAEVRWRVALALHRIHWRIGARLAARIGDLMDGFERRRVGEREMVCRDLALAGLTDAVPTLMRILTTDPSQAVRQAAARALVLLGDDGLKALLDAGVKTKGLDRYTVSVRVHIGNSYLERGELEKALVEYEKARKLEPKNSIVHYNIACTHARMKKLDVALDALERSVECGYRDVDWMEKDSDLDNLRDQPRYKALVKKLREMQQED